MDEDSVSHPLSYSSNILYQIGSRVRSVRLHISIVYPSVRNPKHLWLHTRLNTYI